MRIEFDPDEFETITDMRPCSCGGYPGSESCKRPGGCNGSCSISQRRRPKEDVLRIKVERKRREEDAILVQADAILAARKAHP